jgi:hypothetical protein
MSSIMKRELFGKFPKKKWKSPHFEEEKTQVLKSPRFVEDLGRFLAFFF